MQSHETQDAEPVLQVAEEDMPRGEGSTASGAPLTESDPGHGATASGPHESYDPGFGATGSGPATIPPPDGSPVLVDIPYAAQSNGVINCTTGNWNGAPSNYDYQWWMDDTISIGTNSSSYVIVPHTDAGHSITCTVTAINAVGATTAPPSNAVVVAGLSFAAAEWTASRRA